MLRRIFYGPGDWLASRTDARTRRAIAAWVFIYWLGPGFLMWFFLLHSLLYIGWMSIATAIVSTWALVGTETPTEEEG